MHLQQQQEPATPPMDIIAMLQLMRQENSTFQTNIATQLTHQIASELAPIFTQVDRLTLQVEHNQTHTEFAEDGNRSSMWVGEEYAESEGEQEEEVGDGFAPVIRAKKSKGEGNHKGGMVHANNVLKT